MRPSELPTIAALLVALLGPPLLVVVDRRVFGDCPPVAAQLVLQLVFCSFAAVIVFVVVHFEHLPLSSIGLRQPDQSTAATALLLLLVNLLLLPLVTGPLMRALNLGGFEPGAGRLAALPVWFRVFLGVTSGAVEETLYRGYAIERLSAATGRRWLGALIAVIVFGLAHIPTWGLGPALGADLPFGVVMTLAYLWRRDLVANSIAHSAALVVSLLSL